MDSHFSQYEMGLDQRNTELMSGTPPVQGYASAPGTNTQNGTDSMSPYESSAAMTSPALPPRPNQQPDDHLKKQLHDLHHALAAEVSKNKQYQDLLSQSHNQAEEVNQALSQTTAEVEEYKALWKQSARDLNSHLVNDRGFKPFDDKFFIDKVTLLRRNIRDFAYQYYDNWPADIKVSSNPIREMADMLDLDPNYMCRDLSPSSVVRAYIWGFLGQHVFGRFVWAGNPPAMCELLDSLKPSKESSPADQEERSRQIDLWKARTSTLLQGPLTLRGSNKHKESQEKSFKELTNHLIGLLPPNVKTKDLSEQVSSIWDDAVRLDMVLNTQASGLHLYYRLRKEKPMGFDDTKMEVELERNDSPSSDIVTCVLAPALGRRGESDGTRLAERAYLLKMLVSCQVGDKRPRGQKPEERDHTRSGMIRAAASNLRNRLNINY